MTSSTYGRAGWSPDEWGSAFLSPAKVKDALQGKEGPRHPTLDAIRSLVREREQAIKDRANALDRMHEAERALLESTEALEDTGVEPPDGCDPEGPPSPPQITRWVRLVCDELLAEVDRNARIASENRQLRSDLARADATIGAMGARLRDAEGAIAACGRWELAAQGKDPGPDADKAQRGLYFAVEACQYDDPRYAGSIVGGTSVEAARLYGTTED